jgi:hypothetical protein
MDGEGALPGHPGQLVQTYDSGSSPFRRVINPSARSSRRTSPRALRGAPGPLALTCLLET